MPKISPSSIAPKLMNSIFGVALISLIYRTVNYQTEDGATELRGKIIKMETVIAYTLHYRMCIEQFPRFMGDTRFNSVLNELDDYC